MAAGIQRQHHARVKRVRWMRQETSRRLDADGLQRGWEVASTVLWGCWGVYIKHTLNTQLPNPFAESEALLGCAGLGLMWSPKSPFACFEEVGCPLSQPAPQTWAPLQAAWRPHILPNISTAAEIPMASSSPLPLLAPPLPSLPPDHTPLSLTQPLSSFHAPEHR